MGGDRIGSGRVWAWLLLLLGGGVSLAVNVGHAYAHTASGGEGHGPPGWAIGWAMAWALLVPLMLFVAVKTVTTIRWPAQRRWAVLRWGAAVPVTGLAGYMSWSHMSGLLTSIGEDWLVRVLAWLAVDGLMLLGIGALLATRTTTTTAAGSSSRPTGPVEGNGSVSRSGSVYGSGSRVFSSAGRSSGGV